MGFGEITRLVLQNWVELTNGPGGIDKIPQPAFSNIAMDDPTATKYIYYITFALALIAFISLIRLKTHAWVALGLQ